MAFTLSKTTLRRLLPLRRALEAHDLEGARRELASLTGEPLRERFYGLSLVGQALLVKTLAKAGDDHTSDALRYSREPNPKPRKRIKDQKAMTAYKKQAGQCEIAGPDCFGPLDFSHIKKRSAGGDDTPANGLVLCRGHHEYWERRPSAWWKKFRVRLAPDARRKVLTQRPRLKEVP